MFFFIVLHKILGLCRLLFFKQELLYRVSSNNFILQILATLHFCIKFEGTIRPPRLCVFLLLSRLLIIEFLIKFSFYRIFSQFVFILPRHPLSRQSLHIFPYPRFFFLFTHPHYPDYLIVLLQTAYLKHRRQLKKVLKMKDDDYRKKKEEAAAFGLLETCHCCFADEMIPEECFFCQKGCVFCIECVRRGAETVIGKGDLRFPCYTNCDGEFSLQTLQVRFFHFCYIKQSIEMLYRMVRNSLKYSSKEFGIFSEQQRKIPSIRPHTVEVTRFICDNNFYTFY